VADDMNDLLDDMRRDHPLPEDLALCKRLTTDASRGQKQE